MNVNDVVKVATWVPVSEWEPNPIAVRFQVLADIMREALIDETDGPRLGPGRHEWAEIMRPKWRRDQIRAELDRMGRPAGKFRRPSRETA